jgi:hypothetical protein
MAARRLATAEAGAGCDQKWRAGMMGFVALRPNKPALSGRYVRPVNRASPRPRCAAERGATGRSATSPTSRAFQSVSMAARHFRSHPAAAACRPDFRPGIQPPCPPWKTGQETVKNRQFSSLPSAKGRKTAENKGSEHGEVATERGKVATEYGTVAKEGPAVATERSAIATELKRIAKECRIVALETGNFPTESPVAVTISEAGATKRRTGAVFLALRIRPALHAGGRISASCTMRNSGWWNSSRCDE